MIPFGAQCERCPHTVEDHDTVDGPCCALACPCTKFRWDGQE